MKHPIHAIVMLLAALVLAAPLTAQPAPSADDFAAVETVIDQQMAQQGVPGLAVAVVYQDELVYAQGFGVRSTETNDPVTPDTLFMIASTTKPLTAIGLLRLVDAGLVDLDAPVTTYLPELPWNEDITVRHLLSHTAGLSDAGDSLVSRDPDALRESVSLFSEASLFAPPGLVHSYSNPGIDLVGAIIEAVSGQYYADYMASEVFTPMGMTRSTFLASQAVTFPTAVGYQPDLMPVRPLPDNAAEFPSGFALSSVTDLAHLVAFILNAGAVNETPIMSEGLAQEMQTPASVRLVSPVTYGLGLALEPYRETMRVGHNGNIIGFTSLLQTLPDHDLGVVVLTNSTGFDAEPIFSAVTDALIDLPPEDTVVSAVDAGDLTDFVGDYVLRDLAGEPTYSAAVSLLDGALRLQITGQPPLDLRPTAPDTFELYFGPMSIGQTVAFLRDESGAARYIHVGGRVGVRAD